MKKDLLKVLVFSVSALFMASCGSTTTSTSQTSSTASESSSSSVIASESSSSSVTAAESSSSSVTASESSSSSVIASESSSSSVSADESSSSAADSKSAFTHYDLTDVDVSNVSFVTAGKLTVATSTDFAPMEFVDLTQKGQDAYVGADICLAKAIAEAFNVELVIKAMDFDTTLVALDQGTADIAISGFSYTNDRASSYLYTDCYYSEGDGGQVVVVAKSNASTYTTLDSLNQSGIKIAAQNGALQQDLVTNQLPNATLVAIDNLNDAYDKLSSGAIQGVAVAETVAKTLLTAYPDSYTIVSEHFDFDDSGDYALVKKENTALAAAVNKVIAQIPNEKFKVWVDEATALFANLGDNADEVIPEEDF